MAFVSEITDVGIAAAIAAGGGATTIDITSATFSSDILTPTSAALRAVTGLIHVTHTSGTPELSYHIINANTIMLRVNLAPGDVFNFGSYTLNLSDGTPFVAGTWDTLQIKDTSSARYVEETINFSNATAIINLTILTTIDASLPEVANETLLPAPLSAPYPVYFVHAHTPYNSRPALAMRIASAWFFIDASLITNAAGTTITSDDHHAPLHRFFDGALQISTNGSGQNVLNFINAAGSILGYFYRANDGSIHISANTTEINEFIVDAAGDASISHDFTVGNVLNANSATVVSTIGAGDAITAGTFLRSTLGILLTDGTSVPNRNNFNYVVSGDELDNYFTPDRMLSQSFAVGANWGLGVQNDLFTLPTAYANQFVAVQICFGGVTTFPVIGASAPPDPTNPGSISAMTWGLTQVLITTNYANGNLNVAVGPLGILIMTRGH